jgi:hypothetical protein
MSIDDYIAAHDFQPVQTALRDLLDAHLPQAEGRVYHGHPIWLVDKTMLAGFKVYSSYVTFMIWQGQDVDDPTGRLVPGARRMASVKLASPSDVDADAFAGWLKQL